MLRLLGLAAKAGFVIERCKDEAVGVMERNPGVKTAFTGITLRRAMSLRAGITM